MKWLCALDEQPLQRHTTRHGSAVRPYKPVLTGYENNMRRTFVQVSGGLRLGARL